MAAGLRTGLQAKLYRNTGTWAVPTWNEITAAKDVQLGLVRNMADIKARLSNYIQHLPILIDAPVTFSMINDTSIDDHNVLRDAQIAGTLIGFAVADDAIATSGTEHWRGEYYVSGFPIDQNLEEGMMVNPTLALGYSANVPIWTDVA